MQNKPNVNLGKIVLSSLKIRQYEEFLVFLCFFAAKNKPKQSQSAGLSPETRSTKLEIRNTKSEIQPLALSSQKQCQMFKNKLLLF